MITRVAADSMLAHRGSLNLLCVRELWFLFTLPNRNLFSTEAHYVNAVMLQGYSPSRRWFCGAIVTREVAYTMAIKRRLIIKDSADCKIMSIKVILCHVPLFVFFFWGKLLYLTDCTFVNLESLRCLTSKFDKFSLLLLGPFAVTLILTRPPQYKRTSFIFMNYFSK